MNAQQRVAELEAAKAAKAARLQQIRDTALQDDDRDLTTEERAEFDGLKKEVDGYSARLADEKLLLELQGKASKPVDGKTSDEGSRSRDHTRVKVESRTKGVQFACMIQALATAKSTGMSPVELARRTWPDSPQIAKEIENMQLRAAVAGATTTGAGWAAELAPTEPINELIGMLRPLTVLGRLPGLTPVPFNSKVPVQTSAGGASWVGEGASKPVSAMVFTSVTFPLYTQSKICVLSKQLVQISNPAALPIIQREMLNQLVEFSDTQFLLSTVAISAGVNPASITNGVTGIAASGTAEANIRQDIRALIASFAAGNFPISQLAIVTSEDIGFRIATAVNGLQQPLFPEMGTTGGSVHGVPVVLSNAVTEEHMVGIHSPSVLVGSDNALQVSISEEASLQMDDAPASTPTSATVIESLWQSNRVGIRVEQFQGWLKARATSVNRIHTIAYV